jgi:hypothetical protein
MVVGSKNHDFDFDYIILITKKKSGLCAFGFCQFDFCSLQNVALD